MATNPQDVLIMFQRGMSKRQIADALKISRDKVAELLALAIKNKGA